MNASCRSDRHLSRKRASLKLKRRETIELFASFLLRAGRASEVLEELDLPKNPRPGRQALGRQKQRLAVAPRWWQSPASVSRRADPDSIRRAAASFGISFVPSSRKKAEPFLTHPYYMDEANASATASPCL